MSGNEPAEEKPPRISKRERALTLARERYRLGRATRWPYAQHGERQYRFEGTDRKALAADLRGYWRAQCTDDPPADLNPVIDDLRHLALAEEPDPPSPEEQAAELIAASGAMQEPDDWGVEDAASAYESRGGALGWYRPVKDGGAVWTPLATFDARIIAETIRDDGAEQTLMWTLRVATTDGRAGEIEILPDQLGKPQQWAAKAAGVSALVMPGLSVADHLRVAVQSRSGDVHRRIIYAHTGWRRIGDGWAYLTSSGALGAEGLDTSVAVDLGPLDGYRLPDVRDVRDVREALSLMEIAPDKVMVSVLAAVYRAPLPLPPDCAVWLFGRSGTLKTAVTALAQQHYGPSMDAHGLPGNWTSTANALEAQAFTLDSALYVVDDYSPTPPRPMASGAQPPQTVLSAAAPTTAAGDGCARTVRSGRRNRPGRKCSPRPRTCCPESSRCAPGRSWPRSRPAMSACLGSPPPRPSRATARSRSRQLATSSGSPGDTTPTAACPACSATSARGCAVRPGRRATPGTRSTSAAWRSAGTNS